MPAPDTQRFPQTAADTRDLFLPPPFHRLSKHRSVRIARGAGVNQPHAAPTEGCRWMLRAPGVCQ